MLQIYTLFKNAQNAPNVAFPGTKFKNFMGRENSHFPDYTLCREGTLPHTSLDAFGVSPSMSSVFGISIPP